MPLPDQPPADADWSTTERATTASAGISPGVVSKSVGLISDLGEPATKDSKYIGMSGIKRQERKDEKCG